MKLKDYPPDYLDAVRLAYYRSCKLSPQPYSSFPDRDIGCYNCFHFFKEKDIIYEIEPKTASVFYHEKCPSCLCRNYLVNACGPPLDKRFLQSIKDYVESGY